ncbi:MAG: hypothetical protein ABDI19_10535 [Armatimonadota bacterium]
MALSMQYLIVRTKDHTEVVNSLERFLQRYQIELEPNETTLYEWEPDPEDRFYRFAALNGWQRFVIPYALELDAEDFFEALRYLSQDLETAVMSFSLQESALWSYMLFRDGALQDAYINDPEEVLATMPPELAELAAGDITEFYGEVYLLSELFGVPVEVIEPYLVPLTDVERETDMEIYAHEDDEHPLNDAHVIFDFTQRLGVPIPQPYGAKREPALAEYILI